METEFTFGAWQALSAPCFNCSLVVVANRDATPMKTDAGSVHITGSGWDHVEEGSGECSKLNMCLPHCHRNHSNLRLENFGRLLRSPGHFNPHFARLCQGFTGAARLFTSLQ
jgi:hypothetical protein